MKNSHKQPLSRTKDNGCICKKPKVIHFTTGKIPDILDILTINILQMSRMSTNQAHFQGNIVHKLSVLLQIRGQNSCQ